MMANGITPAILVVELKINIYYVDDLDGACDSDNATVDTAKAIMAPPA
jgi:hypothetical protein